MNDAFLSGIGMRTELARNTKAIRIVGCIAIAVAMTLVACHVAFEF
jgi:hypothetical protein